MTAIHLVFLFLLGAVVGSFLNVVIDRLPDGSSLIEPRSQCDNCQRQLQYWELVPILSYIFLRGRCRTCQATIPYRVIVVELLTASAFLLSGLVFELSWMTPLHCLYAGGLIALAGIDLEHQRIPNLIIYPLIAIALVLIPLIYPDQIWQMLGGGLTGFGVLFLIAVVAPGAMGMGDVKLILFLGLAVGFPVIVLTIFLAFVSGGLLAGILLALKKIGRKDSIAFGPFLALAGFVSMLFGTAILDKLF